MHYVRELTKTCDSCMGVHPELKELAVAALEKLPSHIKGLQGNKEYLYYHPLPRGKRTAKDWLDEFIKQIHFI